MTTRPRRRSMRDHATRAGLRNLLCGAALFAGVASGEQPAGDIGLDEVIVSAQKRVENLQDVPLSISVLGAAQLEQLHVTSLGDYAQFLPAFSYYNARPGYAGMAMRGVGIGDRLDPSGSQPTVGIYLDEQPITAIQGPPDIHLYDIARIEALAGPQGALYGASSLAGAIRIVTNKPDPSAFSAGYEIEGSSLDRNAGYAARGHANIPLGALAALRLVGWTAQVPGYIDNVAGSRSYRNALLTVDNAAYVAEDFNEVDTTGGRAALRLELPGGWSITPALVAQSQDASGSFGYEPGRGDLRVFKLRPEESEDRWGQASLTVEGMLGGLGLTYAGALSERDVELQSDDSDYSYFHDELLYGDSGSVIDPTQFLLGEDRYESYSHELRVVTPVERRMRFVGGLSVQRRTHDMEQRYLVDGLASAYEVTGWEDTTWLTQQRRVDRDEAAFGEVSLDIAQRLTLTGGARAFRAKHSLAGFYGHGDGYSTSGLNGEALCSLALGNPIGDAAGWVPFRSIGTAPCTNIDRRADENGVVSKVNLAWRATDSILLYTTLAEGLRPGGVDPRGAESYDADRLKSYEVGWKSSWSNDSLRFNGAVYWQDWDDFQLAFIGADGVPHIANAGAARVKGAEGEVHWRATQYLTLTGGIALLDPQLTRSFCRSLDADGAQPDFEDCPLVDRAPGGTKLPFTPTLKSNVIARYTFTIGAFDAHLQGAFVHQGASRSALMPDDAGVIGRQAAYSLIHASGGIRRNGLGLELRVSNLFDERGSLHRYVQCDAQVCTRPYVVPVQPRTLSVMFTQKF